MNTLILIFIFTISIVGLTKGADWFLESAEKVGFFLGLSPFIIGVTVVSLGTSFPELFTGIMAVLQNAPEIVAANAIGSNIANILLVVGVTALVGGKLVVPKSLIDLDLPLLAGGTALLFVMIYPFAGDSEIMIIRPESIALVFGYVVYLTYVIFNDFDSSEEDSKNLSSQKTKKQIKKRKDKTKPELKIVDIVLLFMGVFLLAFGSRYLIESAVLLSEIHQIAVGAIAIIAVAIGTTLPELFVSVKAAREGNSELALGNIFGSNIFNSFMVIGIPGLISDLPLDSETYRVGVPFLILATALFVISGISRKIHVSEGIFYLLLYALFIIKVFGLF